MLPVRVSTNCGAVAEAGTALDWGWRDSGLAIKFTFLHSNTGNHIRSDALIFIQAKTNTQPNKFIQYHSLKEVVLHLNNSDFNYYNFLWTEQLRQQMNQCCHRGSVMSRTDCSNGSNQATVRRCAADRESCPQSVINVWINNSVSVQLFDDISRFGCQMSTIMTVTNEKAENPVWPVKSTRASFNLIPSAVNNYVSSMLRSSVCFLFNLYNHTLQPPPPSLQSLQKEWGQGHGGGISSFPLAY